MAESLSKSLVILLLIVCSALTDRHERENDWVKKTLDESITSYGIAKDQYTEMTREVYGKYKDITTNTMDQYNVLEVEAKSAGVSEDYMLLHRSMIVGDMARCTVKYQDKHENELKSVLWQLNDVMDPLRRLVKEWDRCSVAKLSCRATLNEIKRRSRDADGILDYPEHDRQYLVDTMVTGMKKCCEIALNGMTANLRKYQAEQSQDADEDSTAVDQRMLRLATDASSTNGGDNVCLIPLFHTNLCIGINQASYQNCMGGSDCTAPVRLVKKKFTNLKGDK